MIFEAVYARSIQCIMKSSFQNIFIGRSTVTKKIRNFKEQLTEESEEKQMNMFVAMFANYLLRSIF